MAQECPLSAPLTINDTQIGFAGETSTVWTIAPDCSYTVARQIGPQTFEPDRRGRLTPEQQARLKELINQVLAAGQPKQPEGRPQVNARRISLSYGQTQSVLTLSPGGGGLSALRAAAGRSPAEALLELAEQINQMTSG